ncbi:hypothetical protein AVEN_58245-1, partial [Araneus ventricosus]
MRRGPNGALISLSHSTMYIVKLGIHGETIPRQWCVSAPHHSIFSAHPF